MVYALLGARLGLTGIAGATGYLTGHNAVLAAGGSLSLGGLAELIGAIAALVSSITAAYLAFRKRSADERLIDALLDRDEADDAVQRERQNRRPVRKRRR